VTDVLGDLRLLSYTAPGYTCAQTFLTPKFQPPKPTGWRCKSNAGTTLAAGATVVLQVQLQDTPASTHTETLTATSTSVQLDGVVHTATGTVVVDPAPLPAEPTGVQVSQTGDSLVVTWTPASSGGATVTGSTVTAPPATGAVLTAAISGANAGAIVPGVQPGTAYTVAVVSSTASGAGPPSSPVTFTTASASQPPGVPQALAAVWLGGRPMADIYVTWTAASPGNSPIDGYEVVFFGPEDGNPAPGPYTVATNGETTARQTLDTNFDWTVKVRAHNAAGWGPFSAAVTVPAA
jgi:hypothetical protein